jgi:hypothetical protein
MAMSELERDPLEALRDRVEEDYRRAEEDFRRAEENYRLDLAAIEHLQRRFFGSSIPTSNYSPPGNGSALEPPAAAARPQSVDLDESLRSMFNTSRR